MKKKILFGLLALLVIIQAFRIDQTNPPVEREKDLITVTQPPEEIAVMLKNACYDCHSFETSYPWYANVAPASWLLADHRNHGRKHLNFSVWGEYSEKKYKHKLEECIEMVEEGEMPMDSYVWFHSEASLTEAEAEKLLEWFRTEMEK